MLRLLAAAPFALAFAVVAGIAGWQAWHGDWTIAAALVASAAMTGLVAASVWAIMRLLSDERSRG